MDKPQYQWGKMSRGQPYVPLAMDMLRAFFALGLSDIEGALLCYVIEHTWGLTCKRRRKGEEWPPTVPCEIDMKALAVTWECPYQRVQEARSKLLTHRIIVKVEDGFLVNKLAHDWFKYTDCARRPAALLAYAASAQKLNALAESTGENTGFRVLESTASANENTCFCVSLPTKNTETCVFPEDKNTETCVFPYKDPRAGKLSEGNTNPTGLTTTTNAVVVAGRILSLDDDEPFISPPDAQAISLPGDPPTEALRALVVESTGDDEIAQIVCDGYVDAVRKGYPVALVRKVLNNAIKTGAHTDPRRFGSYFAAALGKAAQEAKARATLPDAPPALNKPVLSRSEAKRVKFLADVEAIKAQRQKESEHAEST